MKIIANKICITYGQTGSDETCPYYITLKEPMTVREFIDLWLSNCPGEWGYFGIWKKGSIFGSPKCEYSHGVIKDDPIPDKFLNKKIKKVYGSGGWSRSDFEFVV